MKTEFKTSYQLKQLDAFTRIIIVWSVLWQFVINHRTIVWTIWELQITYIRYIGCLALLVSQRCSATNRSTRSTIKQKVSKSFKSQNIGVHVRGFIQSHYGSQAHERNDVSYGCLELHSFNAWSLTCTFPSVPSVSTFTATLICSHQVYTSCMFVTIVQGTVPYLHVHSRPSPLYPRLQRHSYVPSRFRHLACSSQSFHALLTCTFPSVPSVATFTATLICTLQVQTSSMLVTIVQGTVVSSFFFTFVNIYTKYMIWVFNCIFNNTVK